MDVARVVAGAKIRISLEIRRVRAHVRLVLVKTFQSLSLAAFLAASVLSATGARADSGPATPPLHGTLDLRSMPPSPLVANRKITTWVYLPPGYDSSQVRYPVAYLLSGQPGGWTDCFRSGKVEEMADSLISSGQLAPMILVCFDGSGPHGANDLTDFCNRQDGYRIQDFIVQNLVPYVDATYRTVPTPQNRALWGYSSGGYGALNIGFKHTDVFRILCSHAGFYDPQDDAGVMLRVLGPRGPLWDSNDPLKTVSLLPAQTHLAVYMDASPAEDDYQGFQTLSSVLQKRGDTLETQSLAKAHAWRLIVKRCRESLLFMGKNFGANSAVAAKGTP